MATRTSDRRPAAALGDPGDRVAGIAARHGELLKRVARSYSLCADDAQDAVQRALEIYMRRVSSLDPATELAWLKVVICRILGTYGTGRWTAARRLRACISSPRP